ncbi:hypothetical protein [Microbacterium sp. NPDC057944]|uniref:hypothetical protein n=1 Tax=Microbacterium sp. NPDC057944 TaxID=3346286 RepID=UPI0036DE07B3
MDDGGIGTFILWLLGSAVSWAVFLVLLLVAASVLVWLVIAVVLGVFETRRARRERETPPESEAEDPPDISSL